MAEKIEVAVKNASSHPEGPHWDDTTNSLYYVDCFKGAVKRYNADTGQTDRLELGDTVVSIIIPRQKGGFVVSRKTDLAVVDSWESGQITTVAANLEGEKNMFNDGKVDASGRLWIGSCFCGDGIKDPNQWLKKQGSVYSLDADYTVKKHVGNIDISNGIDWTNDNRTMFYIDSIARQVWAFDFDMAAGKISNQRTVADFRASTIPELGYPDGMAADTEDKLWVALFAAGKVVRIDPETGKIIHTIKFPAEKITSCCFGGKDFSDLYVTSSPYMMTEEELKESPSAGSIFKVTGLGVRGRKANMFAG